MSKLLIIEDEATIRKVLKNILIEENKDYQVEEAEDGEKGFNLLKNNDYDLVFCDIKMPKMDGMEILRKTMETKSYIPFIMISGHGDIQTAVECIKLGAFDFIPKPPDLNRLLTAVRNALNKKHLIDLNQNLSKENLQLKQKVSKKYEMIGNSIKLNELKTLIDKVAPTDARVLITGDNGSGKELVAHQLHEKSKRSKKPMIEVNCAAIPSELIESELFGHMKGSFTGAIKDSIGKFEQAEGGTIFLDEIGDMSLSAQSKVLRALQEHKISRIGDNKEIPINVRIIAATNKNLNEEIKKGNFREDLYHRLSVIEFKVPSLNERKEDIKSLVNHFLTLIANEQGNSIKEIENNAISRLESFNWTGNIRELRNVVERLIILGDNPITEQNVLDFVKK